MEPKPYKIEDRPGDIVCEPLVSYSAITLDPAQRYSYADYLTWADDKRRELIDGIVKLMSAPYTIHSEITTTLVSKLWPFIKKRKGKCKIFHSPIDVRLPKNGETADNMIFTVVHPDIVVVCDPSKIEKRGIIGAPDFVVEVLSPSNTKLAMRKKFDLYEEAGVKEYWVVNPKLGLTVFLLQENGIFDEGTSYDLIFTPDAKVPVHTIEGLEIGLTEFLEE